MNINIEDIKKFLDKKIRLITSNGFTYVGIILSYGTDFIKIKDKYDQDRLISLRAIDILEEAA